MLKKLKSLSFFNFSLLLVIIIIVYGISIYVLHCVFGSWHDGAAFGDTLGAVNTLFAGLAFAGIIYTIMQQKEELELQRDELVLTRKELSGQRKELHKQNKYFEIQKFENTFFNLLNTHHQIIKSMDLIIEKEGLSAFSRIEAHLNNQNTNDTVCGRDVFKFSYLLNIRPSIGNKSCSDLEKINNAYSIAYEKHQSDFSHYFRNLYRMIKFVHYSSITNKYEYVSIIRSHLSNYELIWVFYNCISEYGQDKFKPLIEEYTLFKNLPTKLLCQNNHINYYNDSAFNKLSKYNK